MALYFSVPGLAPNQTSQQTQIPGGFYLFTVKRDIGILNSAGTDLQINSDTTTTLQQLGTDGVTWEQIATVDNSQMQNGVGSTLCQINPAGGACQIVGGSQPITWAGVSDPDSRTIW